MAGGSWEFDFGTGGFACTPSGGTGDLVVTKGGLNCIVGNVLSSGSPGHAELRLSGPGRLSAEVLTLAYDAGTSGSLTVADAVTTLDAAVNVGWGGYGRMVIQDGGTVESSFPPVSTVATQLGSYGEVVIEGQGSAWRNGTGQFWLGHRGAGVVYVRDGGLLDTTNADTQLGSFTWSSGAVVVDGPGARWEHRAVHIGRTGDGVDGSEGILRVLDGGQVIGAVGGTTFVASEAATYGEVSVIGSSTRWVSDAGVYFGHRGAAELMASDGARLEHEWFRMGVDVTASADALLHGGGTVLKVATEVTIAEDGAAVLRLGAGAEVVAADVVVGALGELVGTGTVTARLTNGGMVRPAYQGSPTVAGLIQPPGEMVVHGDFAQLPTGRLRSDLVSTPTAALSGQPIRVSGTATLDGVLSIKVKASIPLSKGDRFKVVEAVSVVGQFNHVDLPPLSGGLAWDVEYDARSVTVSVR